MYRSSMRFWLFWTAKQSTIETTIPALSGSFVD
jgi:hypothetical protein